MIPKSRLSNRGAYRNVVPNTINGVIKDELFGTAVGNKLTSRLTSLNIGEIGDFNNVLVYKRRVSKKKPIKTFTAEVNVSMGSGNSGAIKLMATQDTDIEVNISIGSGNNLEIKTYDTDDIEIDNNNTVFGTFDTKMNGVSIGSNNFLVDFKSEILKGRFVKGFPKIGTLMFSTQVAEYAGVGQTFVVFDNVDRIAHGTEVIFGSVGAGFVKRDVTAVIGNEVHFELPLVSREATFSGALAFNEYYDVLPAYSSTLSEDVARRSKRIFVTHNQNLHLRKVVIGGTFNTTVFFMRETDNMTIVKDMTVEDLAAGTTIASDEVNPYRAWSPNVTQDVNIDTLYHISGLNLAYIRRTVIVDGSDYYIVEFTANTIMLSASLPEGTTSLSFDAIDSSPSGTIVTSYVSANTAGNSMSLPVEDGSKFFIGQNIKVEGMSTLGTVGGISGNTLLLEDKMFQDVITDKFYIGLYELPRNRDVARAVISEAKADLHTFVFGENQ